MLNVVCVNQGNYLGRGKEYVEKLCDMVFRNTSKEFNFICFTDDDQSYDPMVQKRPIPKECKGWFAKLFLFSKEADLKGRTFYFDLDTIINGNLDEYFEYKGKFAILRDFYRPDGYGSGLMAWQEGYGEHIWNAFKNLNYPEIQGGDQSFIEKFVKDADILQDVFPGIIKSYKGDDCERWPPNGSKIICFHGTPRPHEVSGSWIDLIWRIGGARQIEDGGDHMNTGLEAVKANMIANCKLDLEWFTPKPENNKTLVIIGGSPSLKNNLGRLRQYIKLGAHTMTLNGTLKYMSKIGVKPTYHCQFDARPENAEFLENAPDGVRYLIGSMAHPSCFEKLKGKDVVVWHGGFDEKEQTGILKDYEYKPIVIVGGGNTVGLRSPFLGYFMGYRKVVIFGMDSSFSGADHHAYKQPLNDKDGRMDVWMMGKKYECAPWMYRQALLFKEIYANLTKCGCDINVIGDGLIPDMCYFFRNHATIQQKENVNE